MKCFDSSLGVDSIRRGILETEKQQLETVKHIGIPTFSAQFPTCQQLVGIRAVPSRILDTYHCTCRRG